MNADSSRKFHVVQSTDNNSGVNTMNLLNTSDYSPIEVETLPTTSDSSVLGVSITDIASVCNTDHHYIVLNRPSVSYAGGT